MFFLFVGTGKQDRKLVSDDQTHRRAEVVRDYGETLWSIALIFDDRKQISPPANISILHL